MPSSGASSPVSSLSSVVLPAPFGPTRPTRSPRWMRVEKPLTTVSSPKLFEMDFASITSLPDSAASLAAIATTPSAPRWPRKALAHRLQLAEPAHVALAPGGDAVAQPVLLAHDLAAELVLLALFLLEDRVAPCLEMRKALVEPARLAAVEPDGGACDALEEAAVVRDDDDRRRRAVELVFQPLDRGEIEMVGRLVEQQDVGLRRASRGQALRGAPRRRKARPAFPRRSARDGRADRSRDADRRKGRDPPRHRRAPSQTPRGPASAADSGWSPKDGGTPRRPAARSGRPRSSAASTCRNRCGRPARYGRPAAPTAMRRRAAACRRRSAGCRRA